MRYTIKDSAMKWASLSIYLLGVLGSFALAMYGYFDSNIVLNEASLFLIVSGPITILLLVDRLTIFISSEKTKENILREIEMTNINSGSFARFSNDQDWINYMIHNAGRAKSIYNTRLSPPRETYKGAYHDIDKAVAKAVSNGTNYFFICSESRSDTLEETIKTISKNRRKSSGKFSAHCFDTNESPIIQVKIFDYGDYKEALFGFLFPTEKSLTRPVFLIRSAEMIEYFQHVFDTYERQAKQVFPKPDTDVDM